MTTLKGNISYCINSIITYTQYILTQLLHIQILQIKRMIVQRNINRTCITDAIKDADNIGARTISFSSIQLEIRFSNFFYVLLRKCVQFLKKEQ